MNCTCNPCTCKTCQCSAQAAILKTLGNETRLQAILALKETPRTQEQLQEITKLEQSALSHSLKQLETCNIITSKKKGKYKQYQLNKDFINPLWEIITKHAQKQPQLQKRCCCS